MSELDVAGRLLGIVRRLAGPGAEAEAVVHRASEALTRFANSSIHQNVAEETTTVRLRLHTDGRTASGSTTIIDPAGLESLVERTLAAARLTPPDPVWAGLAPPAPLRTVPEYDEETARATPERRAAQVAGFVRAAGGLETAGYCRTTEAAAAFANTAGQAVEGRASEAAMDGVARSGGADGVARVAGPRLAGVDGAVLGARAAAKSRAAGRPIELPPGRYPVVLEPEAVSDLLANLMFFGFNGKAYAQKQSFAVLGAPQFDPAITLTDHPVTTVPFDSEGTPRSTVTLVDAGTTVAVTHDRTSARETGTVSTGHATPFSRSGGPIATHPSLAPGAVPGPAEDDGPVRASARPLVAAVERGLLITDLWYTRVLDQRSLVITGLTRNGVWLIEDGVVTAAVGNMRFTQSYPEALAPGAVRGVGAEQVLLPDRWSGHLFAAPALHLASWNITGNASG